MKVLHVIPSLGPLRGGPSFVVPAIARGLARAGVEVHIAATDDNGPGYLNVPLEQPLTQDGVTYWYFRRQIKFYTFSWPLTCWLARHVTKFDLLHIHSLFSYATLPAALFAAKCQIPYIVRPLGTLTRWGMQQRRPFLKKLSYWLIESRILAHAAAVHYTSEKEQLEAFEYGVKAPAVIIPLGVDMAQFACLPPRGWLRSRFPQLASRTILLFLSRLDPKKGLDLLLSAFADLHARCPDVGLVLAGNGEHGYIAQLRQQAIQLGIDSEIVWTGFLNGKEKLAALSDADLFVLPSYSENFSIAVVEAMASGLPVIISDQVGIYYEVQQAKAGLVIPCQKELLTAAMLRLVTEPELRCRFAANARKLVHQRFSLDVVTKSLIQVYRALVPTSSLLRTT